jgi:solute carrier family 25 (adenine nucleotide translocator) protein 4/5/6/31
VFVYSLDFARTWLASDGKSTTKGGERQFNEIIDVYRKTSSRMVLLDYTVGLFLPSLASSSIVAFTLVHTTRLVGQTHLRYHTCEAECFSEPVVLVGRLQDSFIASFFLGWCVTTGASSAAYPLDTIR